MNKILKQIQEEYPGKVKKQKQPGWVGPMLAKLTHNEFSDKEWIYERKLDGVRSLVFKKGNEVRIMSRNKKNVTNTYPEIIAAFQKQSEENFIVDGEIVAFVGESTSFAELQKRMNLKNPKDIAGHKTKVYYYVFDIMHVDNLDISRLPLLDRKQILKSVVKFKDPIRYSEHREEKGLEFLQEACAKKWEGLIAKKANSKYVSSRSSHWLKFKCTNEQELVIGGFTKPAGARIGFGSLLLGYYEEGKFLYAGKVGTGFTDKFLKEMYDEMAKIETDKPPFANASEIRSKNVHWIKPKLVAQISFTEWTAANKLRHPSFLGLRRDKNAKDVVKES